jgi:heat shock protein HslJ
LNRYPKLAPIAFALVLLVLLGGTATARAEEHPALSGEPLEALAGHGRYWGLSIIGANGGHPIRRPRELWLAFGTITDYGGENFEEKIDEYAALFWESNCNEHSYELEATATRLNLSGGGSSLVLCAGRVNKEERWLEQFFKAGPHWLLGNGHLTLTARGSRIVMHHRLRA